MDDLISRQAAIDALGERPYLWTGGDYELGCANQYDSDKLAIETVQSAHPEMDEWCTDCKEYDSERHCCPRFGRVIRHTLDEVAPRWIPCKERLPEEMGDYLVCDNCQNIYVNEWITTTTTWSWHYDDGRITAWMPLPEPWKGEDND